jgi:hypothetical protein
MDKSKFLARALGLYLIILSLAMLINMPLFTQQINKLIHEPSLMFVCGFFTLIIGVLMIAGHNVWQWNWRVIITIVGWLTIIKAISLIFYPDFIDKSSALFVESTTYDYILAVIDLILGLILVYFGYRR